MDHFKVLSPNQFRELRKTTAHFEESDGEAFREFVSNCRALTLKANTALMRKTDVICSGDVVDLKSNYIGSGGLQAITTLLSKNGNLRELLLSANGIGNDAVVFFCRSFRSHPALTFIDFSRNEAISLAGGLALFSLVQQNSLIKCIDLSGTQVPPPVLAKIARAVEKNKSSLSPLCDIDGLPLGMVGLADKQRSRESSRRERWHSREAEQLRRLREKIPNMVEEGVVPPAVPTSGWRVLEVVILAPPGIFESERMELLERVFPRLNEELSSRRILLMPIMNAAESPPGVYLRQLRFSLSCDLIADVLRSRLVSIELIGDRAGDFQQLPSNVLIDPLAKSDQTPTLTSNGAVDKVLSATKSAMLPLRPVIFSAHEEMLKNSRWIILSKRITTRLLGVPPSLAPLLSSEPLIEHPDKHKSLVKKVAVKTTLCEPNTITTLTGATYTDKNITTVRAVAKAEASNRIGCNYLVEQMKWDELQDYKARAVQTATVPELIVEGYHARFDGTQLSGEIQMKELDNFNDSMYQRLWILLSSTFSVVTEEGEDDFSGPIAQQKMLKLCVFQRLIDQSFSTQKADFGRHKKTITNRLNLYVATPPSRNSLCLHGRYPDVLTSLVSVCAHRHVGLPGNYIVAMHSTRCATVFSEPTDLRSVIIHLLSQLTSNAEVLRYIRNEVEIQKLSRFFRDFLSGGGGRRNEQTLPEGFPKVTANSISSCSTLDADEETSEKTVLLIVLDGLDAIEPPVEPCQALRQSDTGEDVWDAQIPTSWRGTLNGVGFIPKCLGRHVRFITTCCDSSVLLIDQLRSRERDSCDFLDVGESTANDVEVLLCPSTLEKFQVHLSDDDHTLAQRKADSGNPEYMRYLVDALRQLNEEPGFQKQTEMLSSFPEDVKGAASRVLRNLKASFGQPLICKALGLLTASRWGLLLPTFRALLKLSPKRFNELLRLLRPVLEIFSSPVAGEESGNAMLCTVRIVSPSFLELLANERAQIEEEEEDVKVWHSVLTQYYQAIVLRAITSETDVVFRLSPSSPFEASAVKEITYHATKARMWSVLDNLLLSVKFLMLVYRNGLAYSVLRDLIFAFNERNVSRLLDGDLSMEELSGVKSKIRMTKGVALPSNMIKMKDFIFFIRAKSFMLLEHPHLLLQVALEHGEEACQGVYTDAQLHVKNRFSSQKDPKERIAAFFQVTEAKKRPTLHVGEISSVSFAYNKKFVLTGAVDRAISWVEPATGKVAYQLHQPSSRVSRVLHCSTSAYVAVLTVHRGVYIFDGAFGKLVSRNEGEAFNSPVSAFSFSAKGRYYIVATEDLVFRVFESETSNLIATLSASAVVQEGQLDGIHQKRNTIEVLCDLQNDEMFFTIVNNCISGWRVLESRDACLLETCKSIPYLCRNTQWCCEPQTSEETINSFQESRYFMCEIAESKLALIDLHTGRSVTQFSFDEKEESKTITKYIIAPNQQLIAAATNDGKIGVFRVHWESVRNAGDGDIFTLHFPSYIVHAFDRTAHSALSDLAFRSDSLSLFALGNESHLKYWVLPVVDFANVGNSSSSTLMEDVQEILSTNGDYIHPKKLTAISVIRSSSNAGEVEVALGDVVGNLTLLTMYTSQVLKVAD